MQEIFELVNSIFNYADIFELQDSLNNVVDTLKETADTIASAEGVVALEETSSEDKYMSILDIALKGGWLMAPLVLLSIYTIYIFVERFQAIKKATSIKEEFMLNIKDYLYNGNINAAKNLCKNSNTPIARMIEKGLTKLGKPHSEIDHSIESVGKLEIYKLEARIGSLATISGVAPMIGFLGTVIGMIRAFFNLSNSGNNIDPALLAGGIYEALVTTAAGLLIGIVAYWFYNMLINMVEKVIFQMEVNSIEFIDSIPEETN